MNHDIRLRSGWSLVYGAVVMLAGIVGASLWSPWWLLMLPIGLVSIFRLERNVARATLDQLKSRGTAVLTFDTRFYGVANGRFCRGAVTAANVECFEQGNDVPAEGPPARPPARWGRAVPDWSKWSSIAIADIVAIESTSAGNTIRFVFTDRSEEMTCPTTAERDAALGILRPVRPWTVTAESRKEFRGEPMAWILCLPLVLFSVALVATSIGFLQPQQLPLADWNDIKAVRGKGKGVAALWVMASLAYRYVLEQWPPPVPGIVGGVGAVAFAALLAVLQWKTVTDETWTRPV